MSRTPGAVPSAKKQSTVVIFLATVLIVFLARKTHDISQTAAPDQARYGWAGFYKVGLG